MVCSSVAASELLRLTTYFERLTAKIDVVGFTSPAAVGSRILILNKNPFRNNHKSAGRVYDLSKPKGRS
jgi:hypothetical protein